MVKGTKKKLVSAVILDVGAQCFLGSGCEVNGQVFHDIIADEVLVLTRNETGRGGHRKN